MQRTEVLLKLTEEAIEMLATQRAQAIQAEEALRELLQQLEEPPKEQRRA